MKSIKGTLTEQNLLKAFAGESQARSRYTFFASVAKKEGYEQIAGVFMETAEQEREHAKRFFKFLEGGDATITASYPAGKISTTQDNLLAAAMGEKEEWDVLYPDFSKVADEEGFPEIAEAFKRYAWEEAEHASKFAELIGDIVWDTKTNLFKRMNAECGACEDKMRLARLAKEQNLDAVHDTVHEMAKDEARHGSGFQGLYNRYFKA